MARLSRTMGIGDESLGRPRCRRSRVIVASDRGGRVGDQIGGCEGRPMGVVGGRGVEGAIGGVSRHSSCTANAYLSRLNWNWSLGIWGRGSVPASSFFWVSVGRFGRFLEGKVELATHLGEKQRPSSTCFVCIFSRQCDPAAAVSCPTRAHRAASGAMSGCRFVPLGRIDVLMPPCLCLSLPFHCRSDGAQRVGRTVNGRQATRPQVMLCTAGEARAHKRTRAQARRCCLR